MDRLAIARYGLAGPAQRFHLHLTLKPPLGLLDLLLSYTKRWHLLHKGGRLDQHVLHLQPGSHIGSAVSLLYLGLDYLMQRCCLFGNSVGPKELAGR